MGARGGDIQNRKGKERLSRWRICLFKSLSFFIYLSFIMFQHFFDDGCLIFATFLNRFCIIFKHVISEVYNPLSYIIILELEGCQFKL